MTWSLDRLVRRIDDLATMVTWCLKNGKNLLSRNEQLDLTTPAGKEMARLIAGVAEIEAANVSTRLTSLWDYAKHQTDWLVGKPTYGYTTATDLDGHTVLVQDITAGRVLRWSRERILAGASARRVATVLVRSGLCGPGLTVSTLLRRLRNPGLMGFRVEEDKQGGIRRSKLVLDMEGRPIRIAEPIFTEIEFDSLQDALAKRSRNQPARQSGGCTKFLGILLCAACGTNMTVQNTFHNGKLYRYLRCRNCRSGGLGAPNPEEVYARLVEESVSALGDLPVFVREYAYYTERADKPAFRNGVTFFEPGDSTPEMDDVSPTDSSGRWTFVHNGKTFGERWAAEGADTLAADLRRAGVTCEITRSKIPGTRAPKIELELKIPDGVSDRLAIKPDAFAS
ncbi:integrase [Actinocatenispora sera]|uniref:Integrase n=2 Tax=Actinocatenispora sera TaxID=390989 RepID=A0A810L2I9_9ACTN|nr:integrase [Actinocatenispora sera]